MLLPIGFFLTWKAATDSGLFNPDVWLKVYEKVRDRVLAWWRVSRVAKFVAKFFAKKRTGHLPV